eukprot:GILK01001410.1.p1 GENE.GILK01001410.1~~GILK01001410.1.p1  ORF type:complete len:1010 (+),score=194.22 GILK01001410.1:51-3080(+)
MFATLSAAVKRQVTHLSRPVFSQCSRPFHASLCRLQEVNTNDSLLSGTSATYIDQMFEAWSQNPAKVHASWDAYFRNLQAGISPGQAFQDPLSLPGGEARASVGGAVAASPQALQQAISESLKVFLLIRAYQVRGHEIANLDPLHIEEHAKEHYRARTPPAELDYTYYGFTEADLDREFFIGTGVMTGFLSANRTSQTLRHLIARLKETYCGSIGVEYMHISGREECNWIRDKFETADKMKYTKEEKIRILDRLTWADHLESFFKTKFSSAKRFGVEGCESFITGMKAIIDQGVDLGVENIVIGMPHRGRLNVLANVVRKPLEQILCEFQGQKTSNDSDQWGNSGDVKYHLGTSYDRVYPNGKAIHLSLVANPSHLEAVDPLVCGKVRAHQHYTGDATRKKSMGLLIHGDAAFAGQGVVYETMQMSDLYDYTTGGTIHVVVNNQIGFTTTPIEARSGLYCTEVAKSVNAPIFHVNADKPEAVDFVCRLAVEYRQKFQKDVVIDIIGYRRNGHNEADQPAFTQPLMYQLIAAQPPVLKLYGEKLVKEGVLTEEEVKSISQRVMHRFEEAWESSKTYKMTVKEWLSSRWQGFKSPAQLARIHDTGMNLDVLKSLGTSISTIPADFTPHRMIAKIYNDRLTSIQTGKLIDFATGEGLAMGSLLLENNHVRLSGQDVERGTFSHRHAVIHDQVNARKYVALKHLSQNQADFIVCNSNLSEFGVLGFELGYSLANPNSLVIWEAQFGDFANGAQVIIDQFISSGESKWLRQSGLVINLPHGYDGQGPEHSSARLERFLQMSDEDPDVFPEMDIAKRKQIQQHNWQIVNCTTPANYFHVLRRQVHREFRKPLIVITPKRMLKLKAAFSNLEEFGPGQRFKRFIGEVHPEQVAADDKIRRIILCSGQVYYDLIEERTRQQVKDVVVCRVEQLSPFPFDHVCNAAKKYANAEVMWVQEEPLNMGAWTYVQPRIETATRALGTARPKAVGRACAAAPATGFPSIHAQELKRILTNAFA